jgi:hypothetical protein
LNRNASRRQLSGSTVERTHSELERLSRSNHRIIVGPWLSEVGFELLYWIPLLNWAASAYAIGPERLIVVSRGGAGLWYRELAQEFVDLLRLWTVDHYRDENERRWNDDGNQPQYVVGELDREVVRLVQSRFAGETLELLHPALMHQLFRAYWYDKGAAGLVLKHTHYRPLSGIGNALDGLPEHYVAVRFYTRQSFPDTIENRAFVAATVSALATQVPVVLLNTNIRIDDHADLPVPSTGVYRLADLMTPENNLEIQTRAIRHARALVGTYGGLMCLAALCGVPAIGFYSHDTKLLSAHVDMADRLGRRMDAPITMLRVDQAALVGSVTGASGHARAESLRPHAAGS